MTTFDPAEEPQAAGQTQPKRTIVSRLAEVGLWVIAPFMVGSVGAILALVMGAPPARVMGILAFLTLAAGIYFFNRPSTRFKVRQVRAAALIYTGIISGMAALGASLTPADGPPADRPVTQRQQPTAPMTPEQREAERQRLQAAAVESAARQEAQLRQAQEQRRTEYIARLEREMAETTTQTFLQNADDVDGIIIGAAMFSALASVYEDGASLDLSPDQERVRQRFRSRLIQWQMSALPELRNRYGPAVARRVWRDNMEVRTIGGGYRTIEFVWGGFANNANIEDFYLAARENLQALRFRRAQYRWYRGADRYTYYTLEGPGDGELMVTRGGQWVAVSE
jgi:hypothetical protein